MKKLVFTYLFILLVTNITSANEYHIKLNFKAFWNKHTFVLNKRTVFSGKDSIEFESFKFYISGIQFYKNNNLVFAEKNSFHLIDLSDSSTLSLTLKTEKKIRYDRISFYIGIDSTTNVSGAMGGDLDPTKGMYWAWQSGYINFKLEGKCSACKTRGNDFFYHLGGYSFPNNSLQKVELTGIKNNTLTIGINVNSFFSDLNVAETNQIMSPGKKAVMLSEKAVHMFSIQK